MIDTVKFLFDCPVKMPSSSSDVWKRKRGVNLPEEGNPVPWFTLQHNESDLRIFGHGDYAESVEVSLPKLLYGTNGKLLRAGDIDSALNQCLDITATVVEEPSFDRLSRLDLVHHFEGYLFESIESLRGLKHRRIRRKGVEFFDTGLEWPGKELRVRLYDKQAEQGFGPGMIQRLEFQMRGKALPTHLWSSSEGFDVEGCYSHYKALCGGFSYRSVPRLSSVADLLVFLKINDCKLGGVDPVSLYMNSKSKRTRYRLEAQMRGVKLEYFEANFISKLPELVTDLDYLDCLRAA